ncbi:mutator type transposase [Tanacetum coccineum]
MAATGLESNNEIYPLAYALVEAKSKSSWCWFLQCLSDDIDLQPNSNFTFISDKQMEKSTSPTTLSPQNHHVKIDRPRKKRKRSKLEDEPFVKHDKLSKGGRSITCQSCGNIGHAKDKVKSGNNVEANDSASGQAEQAEPTVGQDGSGSLGVGQVPNAYDSSVGDVIGLASVGRQPGRTGVSVEGRSSSLASSPSRWTKRKYKQKDLVHKKRTPTQPATLPSTHSQVQVTGIPTQSSAAVGASEWTIL